MPSLSDLSTPDSLHVVMSCFALEPSSSVDILLLIYHFITLTLFFFVESLLTNFLLTTHDVTDSTTGGRREGITPIVLLMVVPCGKSIMYLQQQLKQIKHHEKWPQSLPILVST